MHQDHLDMETVTLEFEDEELEQIDDIAFKHHRDNREAAMRDMLDKWLKARDDEQGGEEQGDDDG